MNMNSSSAEQVREPEESNKRKIELVWRNIILFTVLHIGALYGLFLCLSLSTKFATFLFGVFLFFAGEFGITAGSHRLWSHRSYKAKWPLRVLLVFLTTVANQNSVIEWVRDHRVHHKYTDTDADPHNAKRGFFFSHIGWLLCRKHPDVKIKGQHIDISDLYTESILVCQHKYFLILSLIFCFALPTAMYFWKETFINAFYVNILRYTLTLNCTWLVNSAAHIWGTRPYDRFINPAENKMVAMWTIGEGWHNYHHTFPWDYKTSELGKYSTNFTLALLDLCSKIGWVYDAKTASEDMIRKRIQRTGDGSHEIWGWEDKDQLKDDFEDATVLYEYT